MYRILSKFIFILVNIILFSSLTHASINYDKLIVFGDSLSDTGNLFEITTQLHKVSSKIPMVPKSPPYYLGRFSNGLVWTDWFSRLENILLDNYALGGSWVEPFNESKIIFPYSFGAQVDKYLVGNLLDTHKSKHLYVIWGGGNDYLNGREDLDLATTQTINEIKSELNRLVAFGARNFLILNLPDLGRTPSAAETGPAGEMNLTQLSKIHNFKLNQMLNEMRITRADVHIILFDTESYFKDIIAYPEKYQLKNVTESCYTGPNSLVKNSLFNKMDLDLNAQRKYFSALQEFPELQESFIRNPVLRQAYLLGEAVDPKLCKNPNEYLFWDGVHPSEAVHHLLALRVQEVLEKG